jgi:hypothetical protein
LTLLDPFASSAFFKSFSSTYGPFLNDLATKTS